MQRDLKTGHLSQAAYTQQAVEILTALKKLGEQVWALIVNKFHLLTPKTLTAILLSVYDTFSVNVSSENLVVN